MRILFDDCYAIITHTGNYPIAGRFAQPFYEGRSVGLTEMRFIVTISDLKTYKKKPNAS